MLENFIAGSFGEVNQSEMFQIVFKMLPCYEYFFVNNFCTYCSNAVERNPLRRPKRFLSLKWLNIHNYKTT